MGDVVDITTAKKARKFKADANHMAAVERLCEFVLAEMDDIDDEDLMLAFLYMTANAGIDAGADKTMMVKLMKAIFEETQRLVNEEEA